MRINDLVTKYLNDSDNLDKLKYMSNLNGGWERWFQLELAYYYANIYKHDPRVSLTEVIYGEESKRCDLVFFNVTTNSNIYLEIKCQTTHQDLKMFSTKLRDDYKKMIEYKKPVTVLGLFKESIDDCVRREIRNYLIESEINADDILFYHNNKFVILEKLASLE